MNYFCRWNQIRFPKILNFLLKREKKLQKINNDFAEHVGLCRPPALPLQTTTESVAASWKENWNQLLLVQAEALEIITVVLPTVGTLLRKAAMRVHLPGREDRAFHACLPVTQKKADKDEEEALDTNQDKNFEHKDRSWPPKDFTTNPRDRSSKSGRDTKDQLWTFQRRYYLPNSLL